LNKENIQDLPQDKPVVNNIINKQEENIYTSIAKRGNVQESISDHLSGNTDAIPGGVKVQIE
jgi:hypothetical protein